MTLTSPRVARALGAKARENGGEALGPLLTCWNVSGDCEHPVTVNIDGRQFREVHRGEIFDWIDLGKGGGHVIKRSAPHFVEMKIRCRKCDPCFAFHRRTWERRLRREFSNAARTWFGTLTASPSWRFYYIANAVARLRAKSVEFDKLSLASQRREIAKEMGNELTKYVKRIRERCRVRGIRTFFVFETHKNGMPHIHGLFFEPLDGRGTITKRHLDSAWSHGFSHWRLLTDPNRLTYSIKYITKEKFLRIRASNHLGRAPRSGGQRPEGTVKRDKGRDPLP